MTYKRPMRVLLLSTGEAAPAGYIQKLASWGIATEQGELPLVQQGREKEADLIARIGASIRARYGDTIDLIQVYFTTRDWPISGSVKGKQYHAFFSDYQVAIVRHYGKHVAGTSEHELMHSLDNFCRVYTGVSLAGVVGVNDWDEDIVHRRGPKGGAYLDNFDDVYPRVRPYVEAAINERARLAAIRTIQTTLARLLAELRKMQINAKKPEEMPETSPETPPIPPPSPVLPSAQERLYNAAKAAIGKDLTPLDEVDDSVACVAQMQAVIHDALGFFVGYGAARTNTLAFKNALKADHRFRIVKPSDAQPGDIAVCATGESLNPADRGHCWVVGKVDWMSNDSRTGRWDANYTKEKILSTFVQRSGFTLHVFRPVG